MKFKELFAESKSELEKLIPLVKKHKEINKVELVKLDNKFGKGEYLEVTFKNSEYRADVVEFLRTNVTDEFNYDYDGTALLISLK